MINHDAFTPVLRWLDADAPHDDTGFNMGWVRMTDQCDYSGTPCGAVMCIAGALQEFNDWGNMSLTETAEWAGMTYKQGRALFLAEGEDDDVGSLLPQFHEGFDSITPAEAAATIRRMLKTGKVVW